MSSSAITSSAAAGAAARHRRAISASARGAGSHDSWKRPRKGRVRCDACPSPFPVHRRDSGHASDPADSACVALPGTSAEMPRRLPPFSVQRRLAWTCRPGGAALAWAACADKGCGRVQARRGQAAPGHPARPACAQRSGRRCSLALAIPGGVPGPHGALADPAPRCARLFGGWRGAWLRRAPRVRRVVLLPQTPVAGGSLRPRCPMPPSATIPTVTPFRHGHGGAA